MSAEARPEDIFDRLMALWQEPWSEPAFGEAQMLVAALRAAPSTDPALDVWAVQFSNYDPAEIYSLYLTREAAEACADDLNERDDTSMWEVSRRKVERQYVPDHDEDSS